MSTINFPKLLPEQLRIVHSAGLPIALGAARTTIQNAPAPTEFIPDDIHTPLPDGLLAAGDQFVRHGEYREVRLSQEEVKAGREAIQKARAEIEKVLQSLEETIRHPDPVWRFMFALSILLILSALAIILWGVRYGSHIELAGKGGVATLLFSIGFGWVVILMRKTWNLRTLIRRIRARLALCSSHADYRQAHECFSEALDGLDRAFR